LIVNAARLYVSYRSSNREREMFAKSCVTFACPKCEKEALKIIVVSTVDVGGGLATSQPGSHEYYACLCLNCGFKVGSFKDIEICPKCSKRSVFFGGKSRRCECCSYYEYH
jgi:hypothetical protein